MTTRRRAHASKLSLVQQITWGYVRTPRKATKYVKGASRHESGTILGSISRHIWDNGKQGKWQPTGRGGYHRPLLRVAGWKKKGWWWQ